MKLKGFWNDPEGLSIGDIVIWATLPPWLYTAYHYALAADLSGNQVDFFLTLTYPLLMVLGGKAISDLPPLKRLKIEFPISDERDDRGANSSPRI